MAITFTTSIPTDKWLFSENNRIVEFSSNYSEPPLYCDITIGSLDAFRIYPLPSGTFWANLKSRISSLLNQYADDLDLSTINPADIDTFVFDWSRVYYNNYIEFVITFADAETEQTIVTPYIILGAEQIYNYKRGETVSGLDNIILSPFKNGNANRFHLRYWDGYPFDFGYTLSKGRTSQTQTIENLTNAITSPNILFPQTINRLFISDGDTNESLEDYLPLVEGYNELQLLGETRPIFIDLWKMQSDCGVYLKWINEYGGYNYWLFNRYNQIDKNIRSLGEVNNDFENLENIVSQTNQLGKTSNDQWTIVADGLASDDINVLKGILTSPKVYLFTGERFTKNNFNDWVEVSIPATTTNIKQPKITANELRIRIELPQHYNITL